MLNICNSEILRYMGCPQEYETNDEIMRAINSAKNVLLSSAAPKVIYEQFEISEDDDGVKVCGSDVVLKGQSIRTHLNGCRYCVIMAATLGIEADRTIRRAQLKSVSDGLAMDACATAYIEAVCDSAEEEIKQKFGLCNFRFSPGYGDLPISQQKEIISLLGAEKKIGLCVNEGNLMIPVKSVTAVLGITDKCEHSGNKCDKCPNRERCAFSRNEK